MNEKETILRNHHHPQNHSVYKLPEMRRGNEDASYVVKVGHNDKSHVLQVPHAHTGVLHQARSVCLVQDAKDDDLAMAGYPWGPLNIKNWTEEKANAHQSFCENREITVPWSCYVRLQKEEEMIKMEGDRRSHAWGPQGSAWTKAKARAHATYCKTHGITLSYEEYRERVKSGEAERKRKELEKATNLDPSSFRGGRSTLMRPASEIVAKILAKVA